MDAEIELELAQGGLCCMMGGIGAIAGATGVAASGAGVGGGVVSSGITVGTIGGPSGGVMAPLRDGGGGGAAREGHTHHRCRLYSPAQVRGLSDFQESNYC